MLETMRVSSRHSVHFSQWVFNRNSREIKQASMEVNTTAYTPSPLQIRHPHRKLIELLGNTTRQSSYQATHILRCTCPWININWVTHNWPQRSRLPKIGLLAPVRSSHHNARLPAFDFSGWSVNRVNLWDRSHGIFEFHLHQWNTKYYKL